MKETWEFLNAPSSILTYKDYLTYNFKKELILLNHLRSLGNLWSDSTSPLALELITYESHLEYLIITCSSLSEF